MYGGGCNNSSSSDDDNPPVENPDDTNKPDDSDNPGEDNTGDSGTGGSELEEKTIEVPVKLVKKENEEGKAEYSDGKITIFEGSDGEDKNQIVLYLQNITNISDYDSLSFDCEGNGGGIQVYNNSWSPYGKDGYGDFNNWWLSAPSCDVPLAGFTNGVTQVQIFGLVKNSGNFAISNLGLKGKNKVLHLTPVIEYETESVD